MKYLIITTLFLALPIANASADDIYANSTGGGNGANSGSPVTLEQAVSLAINDDRIIYGGQGLETTLLNTLSTNGKNIVIEGVGGPEDNPIECAIEECLLVDGGNVEIKNFSFSPRNPNVFINTSGVPNLIDSQGANDTAITAQSDANLSVHNSSFLLLSTAVISDGAQSISFTGSSVEQCMSGVVGTASQEMRIIESDFDTLIEAISPLDTPYVFVSHNDIESASLAAIELTGTRAANVQLDVEYNTIVDSDIGIKGSARTSPILLNLNANTFQNGERGLIFINGEMNMTNNVISGMSYVAALIDGDTIRIAYNTFVKNEQGIQLSGDGDVTILNNIFAYHRSQTFDLHFYGQVFFDHNNVWGNGQIYTGSTSTGKQ